MTKNLEIYLKFYTLQKPHGIISRTKIEFGRRIFCILVVFIVLESRGANIFKQLHY